MIFMQIVMSVDYNIIIYHNGAEGGSIASPSAKYSLFIGSW